MANEEQLAILKSGVENWNHWARENAGIGINLVGANLSEAELWGADLYRASLSGANFTGAQLGGADLSRANLSNVNFTRANLGGVNLAGANLFRSDFNQASILSVNFADVDLRHVINLEKAMHYSPSPISISTVYKSKGQIPHKFLREAGVPENFITYMSSLTGKAFEYYSCFISYTEADDAISKRLYADLQTAGLRVWRWREDAKWGAPIEKNIDQAVRIYDKLIVICSEDSLKAPAVIDEISRAMQKKHDLMKDGKIPEVLFPITIDDYIFEEWEHYLKPKVMVKTVGDFRGWEDPRKYDSAIERLIAALRQEEG